MVHRFWVQSSRFWVEKLKVEVEVEAEAQG
jgi:hypothetical protein